MAEAGAPSGTVCLAEHQSAGRGRRGRTWHSPFGSNIYLSVLWRFADGMNRLSSLSLVSAVALMRCFIAVGATGIGIKWPNDIITEQGKLAGILVDVAGESSGPCYAVIGIGINYQMSDNVGQPIDQVWSRLADKGVSAGRNALVAQLLCNLVEVLTLFDKEGFTPFRQEWLDWDMLRDQDVLLHWSNENLNGIARGIDDAGMLLIERDGKLKSYAAGEVSLRRANQ